MSCTFCAIATGDAPAAIVHRDDRTVAFMDINPVTPGHTLVIPRAHADDLWDVSPDDAAAVMVSAHHVAAKLRAALEPHGLNLFQATRAEAFQTVFHLHVHVLPRWAGDLDVAAVPWHPRPTSLDDLAALAIRIAEADPDG